MTIQENINNDWELKVRTIKEEYTPLSANMYLCLSLRTRITLILRNQHLLNNDQNKPGYINNKATGIIYHVHTFKRAEISNFGGVMLNLHASRNSRYGGSHSKQSLNHYA